MNARLHALQIEIKTIESIMGSLNGSLLQSAQEELKNMRFELDMLNRNLLRINKLQTVGEEADVLV